MFEQNNQPNKLSQFWDKLKKKIISIKDEIKNKLSHFFDKHPLPNKLKKPAKTFAESNQLGSNELGETRFAFWFNVTYGVFKSLILMVIVVVLFVAALVGGIGAGYFAYLVSDTPVPTKKELDSAINDLSEITFLNYSNGDQIAEIKSDIIRTTVSYDDISPLVLDAIISTEDENFYEHDGVVPKAVVRALISDTIGAGSSSGGSTLTQQIVKQQVLTSETTFKRKANEILLAMRVDQFFSKKEIITAYLNVSPFGRNNKGENIAGVQEAAIGIFGVNAKDLSLPQAAFISGLPQSPITYSPYKNTGELKEDYSAGLNRKDDVLFNMYRNHKITKQEYDEALSYDLAADFLPQGEATPLNQSGYLYYYVLEEAIKVLMPSYYEADNVSADDITASDSLYNKYYAIAERELRRSGYTIQSTIDHAIYDTMQTSVATHGASLDEGNGKTVETGSVLLENTTGKVLGLIGGRDYNTNQNNHATVTRRSPGSTIKPYLEFGPAFDVGLIGTQSLISNFPTNFSDGKTVTNYGGKSGNSFVTAEYALNQSLNIPAYHLHEAVKKETDIASYIRKMNIGLTDEELSYESIALGGADWGPTNMEQVGAFATLANGGKFNQPYVIEKITDSTGKVVYEHESKPVDVFSPATASIMNELMRSVVQTGTGTTAKNTMASLNATLASADWVGKTGTSQDDKDFWFIASTPSVTLSAWSGYDNGSEMGIGGGQTNMRYWANVINDIYQVNPDIVNVSQKFELDSSVIKADVAKMTGEKTGSFINNNKIYNVGEPLVSSLFAKKGPVASRYKFGIGGTDANYASVWGGILSEEDKKAEEEQAKAEDEQKKAEEEQAKAEADKSSSSVNSSPEGSNSTAYDAEALAKWRKDNGKSDSEFPRGSVTYGGNVIYY